MDDGGSGTLNPWKVYAESCIYHHIGALHGDALDRLKAVDAQTLKRGEHWLDVFLGEFSITTSTIEFIVSQWQKERSDNPPG